MNYVLHKLSRNSVWWSLLGITSAAQLLYFFWKWVPFSFGASDPNHATVKLLVSMGLFAVVLMSFSSAGGASEDENCRRISKISGLGLKVFGISVLSGLLIIGIVLVPLTVGILGIAFFINLIRAWFAKVE